MKLPKPKDLKTRVRELKKKGMTTRQAMTLALAETRNHKGDKEK